MDFVDAYEVRGNEPFTHGSVAYRKKYYVEGSELEEFLTRYSNAVSKKSFCSVTEKIGFSSPLRVDIDLKSDLSVGLKRQYTPVMVNNLIKLYQDEIKRCTVNYEPKYSICLVLTKPSPREEESIIKDGFHLHFPFMITTTNFRDNYLLERIKPHIPKIFEGIQTVDLLEKALDRLGNNPWLMYGSSKSQSSGAFLFSRAVDENLKPIRLETIFKDQMVGRKKSVNYYLPRFLSVRGHPGTLIDETKMARVPMRKMKAKPVDTEDTRTDEQVEKDKELAVTLVPLLSVDRADEYNTWMDVGWTLYCIYRGECDGQDLWEEFSQRSHKYQPGVCDTLWSKMICKGKSMGSLIQWAKEDSPEEYEKLFTEGKVPSERMLGSMPKSVIESVVDDKDYHKLFQGERGQAELFAQAVKNNIKVFDDKRVCIWSEDKALWEVLSADFAINTIPKILDPIVKHLEDNPPKNDDPKEDEPEKPKRGRPRTTPEKTPWQLSIDPIKKKLQTRRHSEAVFRFAKTILMDKDFETTLDSIPYLIPIADKSCVDLRTGEVVYRTRDHLFSFSLDLTLGDPEHECNSIFEKVMIEDPDRIKFFQKVAGYAISGETCEKKFFINNGNGNNGKSAVISIFETVLGKFADIASNSIVFNSRNNDRHSDNATPGLVSLIGKRFIVNVEVKESSKLNEESIKRITGGDTIQVRRMRAENETVQTTAKLFLFANECPSFSSHDKAMRERIIYMDWHAQFVEKLTKDAKNQYLMDKTLLDRIRKRENVNHYFAWLVQGAVEYYRTRDLTPPKVVLEEMNKYFGKNDTVASFIKSECTLDPIGETKFTDFHMAYVQWCKDNKITSIAKNALSTRIFKDYERARKAAGPVILGLRMNDDGDIFGGKRIMEPISKVIKPKV
jgi:P4 family phage/plasmid primase-like protien